jgi:hypothetical protein
MKTKMRDLACLSRRETKLRWPKQIESMTINYRSHIQFNQRNHMKNLHEMHVTYQSMRRPSQTKFFFSSIRNTKQMQINHKPEFFSFELLLFTTYGKRKKKRK